MSSLLATMGCEEQHQSSGSNRTEERELISLFESWKLQMISESVYVHDSVCHPGLDDCEQAEEALLAFPESVDFHFGDAHGDEVLDLVVEYLPKDCCWYFGKYSRHKEFLFIQAGFDEEQVYSTKLYAIWSEHPAVVNLVSTQKGAQIEGLFYKEGDALCCPSSKRDTSLLLLREDR